MTRVWTWPAIFCGYFLVQVAIRLAFGPALELDEAEAFFYARHLSIGYSAQPPLYFWLQWGLFQVVGEGLLALALLKAMLLTFSLSSFTAFCCALQNHSSRGSGRRPFPFAPDRLGGTARPDA